MLSVLGKRHLMLGSRNETGFVSAANLDTVERCRCHHLTPACGRFFPSLALQTERASAAQFSGISTAVL